MQPVSIVIKITSSQPDTLTSLHLPSATSLTLASNASIILSATIGAITALTPANRGSANSNSTFKLTSVLSPLGSKLHLVANLFSTLSSLVGSPSTGPRAL